MPGPPWQPGAAKVEPVDADRRIAENLGPGSVRAHQIGVQEAVTNSPAGRRTAIFASRSDRTMAWLNSGPWPSLR
jgi:hypothetical protein